MSNNKNKTFFGLSLITILSFTIACQQTNKTSDLSSDSSIEESSIISEELYSIVRPEFEEDFVTYEVSPKPSGVNMTYYSDIYSRGFSWITDDTVEDTDLYLVQSDKGKDADFSAAEHIQGETKKLTLDKSGNVIFADSSYPTAKGSSNSHEQKCNSHKVHIEDLEKGKAYSYKIGSEAGYTYGAFIVEKEAPESITAIECSDAQTLEPDKLNVWRNTFVKGVKTAGNSLDFVLYNGDQFDQNMGKVNSSDEYKPLRFNMYSKALDVINDYKADIPYMASSGNHEPSAAYSQFLHSDINYSNVNANGCYYSYDYGFAHFVVLNTNNVNDAQINWLKQDLEGAKDAKWKVVTMHISPYATGDHSNKSDNQKIIEKFTPIFSENHVDLVLQAHDHTYNKTLPYKWDSVGYTTLDNDEDVVNFNPEKELLDGVEYDKNPNGTYYVTTGAAGHRVGARESDGIWAEVVVENGEVKPLDSKNTFLNNKYKNAYGVLTQTNSYEPCSWGSFNSSQQYVKGNPATGNVNAQMFGVLNITETTMSYYAYTVNGDTVKLFDTLDVLKA